MKTIILPVATLLSTVLYTGSANAQETTTALVPLPSVVDFTDGDGWGVGLGLGIEYESAYEGSDEFGVEVEPAGGVQWRKGDNVFFWAGEAIGWRGLVTDSWLLQATLGYEEGREEGDSDDGRLNGLGDSSSGGVVVLEGRYDFGENWRYFLDARLSTGAIGTLGIVGVGTCLACQPNGTGLEIGAVVTFHDSELANRDFGVTMQQSIDSGLPATNVDSGFRSVGVNVNYRYYVNENWQLFAEGLYESYGSDVSDSPISRNDYEAELGVGFIYVF